MDIDNELDDESIPDDDGPPLDLPEFLLLSLRCWLFLDNGDDRNDLILILLFEPTRKDIERINRFGAGRAVVVVAVFFLGVAGVVVVIVANEVLF